MSSLTPLTLNARLRQLETKLPLAARVIAGTVRPTPGPNEVVFWADENFTPPRFSILMRDGQDVIANDSFYLGDTEWDDIRVPISTTNVGAPNAPAFNLWLGAGAGVYAYQFSATTREDIYFMVQLPHSYKEGTELHPHVHWAPASAGAANARVVWKMEYSWANVGDVFPATTTISTTSGTPLLPNDGSLVKDKHYMSFFPTIDGTGKTISSMLACRVYRDPADAADNYAGLATLLEWDAHYQLDSIGSRTTGAK